MLVCEVCDVDDNFNALVQALHLDDRDCCSVEIGNLLDPVELRARAVLDQTGQERFLDHLKGVVYTRQVSAKGSLDHQVDVRPRQV